MGIQSLTKHVLPYAETVVLDGSPSKTDLPPCVRSVVIDGPSLVYHVYYKLLAWSDLICDKIDPQPTCDQVSRGVASCLLQLKGRGIKIHGIFFDGALPISKRGVRLDRIEKSRQRLELSRQRTFPLAPEGRPKQKSLQPLQFWQNRSLPSRLRRLPENPFMVAAVYEDLKQRWSTKQMAIDFQLNALQLQGEEYPWAGITAMVPGEADFDCARISKLTGAAVLTDDSDLVVHDLGPRGAVVLLKSLHLLDSTLDQVSTEIRGLRISLSGLSNRPGIKDIQRFAYELTQNPQHGLSDLVRRANEDLGTCERTLDYHKFIQEYQGCQHDFVDDDQPLSSQQRVNDLTLDPRVSELFWQYERPKIYCRGQNVQPHVYMGILSEDHSRRCAWEQGRMYRALGYSILNQSYPEPSRFPVIQEFVRRGGRIVAEEITLCGAKTIASDLDIFHTRLKLAQTVFGDMTQPRFWVMFAISEIWRNCSNHATLPNAANLEHFLKHGYTTDQAEWSDLHLASQIQAVLYSLRILKQLLGVTNDLPCSCHQSILSGLPPLHILLGSRHEMTQEFLGDDMAHRSVYQLIQTYS
ncbi:hypothetical protein N7478_012068 [Penicillium angulare]|uniref:uncharacterized protein n=1 Tax=Penicillium angulare TaxID=116970 RepID=UPI00253F7BD3|nr:uncharacterized protein N7478_012068 [Penicillium angulare]KAJ5261473.1 hypothetical protein N7478_012068 [Penicillium angulare]